MLQIFTAEMNVLLATQVGQSVAAGKYCFWCWWV
jgi:hypothetical protein